MRVKNTAGHLSPFCKKAPASVIWNKNKSQEEMSFGKVDLLLHKVQSVSPDNIGQVLGTQQLKFLKRQGQRGVEAGKSVSAEPDGRDQLFGFTGASLSSPVARLRKSLIRSCFGFRKSATGGPHPLTALPSGVRGRLCGTLQESQEANDPNLQQGAPARVTLKSRPPERLDFWDSNSFFQRTVQSIYPLII